jgi:hypothetical protein
MADTKISALPASTTPLAGTEVLPIVQSGVTKQVSVANLTAGRAVSSAGGTFTDNFVQGTAAKGVNFTANTPAAGMTSQLLNWYEEGTWTPVVKDAAAGNAATAAASGGFYTKIGRQVTVTVRLINITTTGLTGTNQIYITGLPFAAKGDVRAIAVGTVAAVDVTSTTGNLYAQMDNSNSYFQLYNGLTTGQSNALVSQIVSGSGQLFITLTYTTA